MKNTIINKLKNISKNDNRINYPIDNSNDKIDSQVLNIHEKIHAEIETLKLYPEKNLSNNIVKAWKNFDDKLYKGNKISKIINNNIKYKKTLDDNNFIFALKKMKEDGIAELNNLNLKNDEVDKIISSLKEFKLYPCHVPWQSQTEKINFENIKNSAFGTYDLDVIFKFNSLVKILFDENLLKLIENYFGCLPTLCSVNLYWNLPNKKQIGPKFFHRDVDDYKIVNVFCILTDTDDDNGSYSHIIATHDKEQMKRILLNNKFNINSDEIFNLPMNGYGFENIYEKIFQKNIKKIFGKAGKVIIADGYGLHKADHSKDGRLMFWGTYSLTKTSCEIAQKPLQKKVNYQDIRTLFSADMQRKYVGRHFINF